MLTNPSGEVTGTFSHSAYGSPAGSSGTETTPLGYAGQLTNSQSGLQYLRARVYDPRTGQFLSRDPLWSVTGEAYGYANNNPINGFDPSGLCNKNPASTSFWTEGNCISESSFNPLPYYEREIEALEAGCSFWESVRYGAEGAVVAASNVGMGSLLKGAAAKFAGAAAEVVTTPGGRVLSAHYLTETGPGRAIPISVLDEVINYGQVARNLADRIVYYDPVNNVTVVLSKTTGKIMSARKGSP